MNNVCGCKCICTTKYNIITSIFMFKSIHFFSTSKQTMHLIDYSFYVLTHFFTISFHRNYSAREPQHNIIFQRTFDVNVCCALILAFHFQVKMSSIAFRIAKTCERMPYYPVANNNTNNKKKPVQTVHDKVWIVFYNDEAHSRREHEMMHHDVHKKNEIPMTVLR